MKNGNSKKINLLITSLSFIFLAGCSKNKETGIDNNDVVVIAATGDINPGLNEFRQLLGDQLNTTPGVVGGRREINWDGVPDQLLNQKLPEDFFNPTGATATVANQRGLLYSSAGNFQVSKTNFAEVNPAASGQFASFSGDKSFANINSNLWEVGFEVPGQAMAATVKGFGIVFLMWIFPKPHPWNFLMKRNTWANFLYPLKMAVIFLFWVCILKTNR